MHARCLGLSTSPPQSFKNSGPVSVFISARRQLFRRERRRRHYRCRQHCSDDRLCHHSIVRLADQLAPTPPHSLPDTHQSVRTRFTPSASTQEIRLQQRSHLHSRRTLHRLGCVHHTFDRRQVCHNKRFPVARHVCESVQERVFLREAAATTFSIIAMSAMRSADSTAAASFTLAAAAFFFDSMILAFFSSRAPATGDDPSREL
jgi:hypothetical protein